MNPSGTRMVLNGVGASETTPAHISLDEVLTLSARHRTDPLYLSFGPLEGPGPRPAFAALVAALDGSGALLATWTSEPVFGSSEAAVEHAYDAVLGDPWAI
jgi:hypothetical protein